LAVTVTVGGAIEGYWLIGNVDTAMIPIIEINIEITIAVTGLLINTSEIILYLLDSL